jgi:hypothetical protein
MMVRALTRGKLQNSRQCLCVRHWLDSPRMDRQPDVSSLLLRLDRATEHLETLREEIRASEKSDALSLFPDKEPKSRRKVIRLRVTAEPLPRLGLLAGEICYQLRSTLNNLVAQCVSAAGYSVTHDHAYPILQRESDWTAAAIKKLLGGLRDEQIAIVREYQPFLSHDPANHPLLAIARLANLDKHHTIPPAFVLIGRARIQVHSLDPAVSVTDFEWVTSEFATPLHEGAILCSFLTSPDPDSTVTVKWDAQLPIGFGEPVAATITDLSNMVPLVRTIVERVSAG